MESKQIPARFKGRCRTCGAEVAEGEQVWWKKHYGVKCSKCGKHTDADAPLPRKNKRKGGARKGRKKADQGLPDPPMEPRGDEKPWVPQEAEVEYKAGELVWGDGDGRGRYVQGSDGVHRLAYESVKRAVENAFDDWGNSDGNREWVREAMREATSGRCKATAKWANHYDEERFLHDVDSPPQHLLDAIEQMKQHVTDCCDVQAGLMPQRKIRRGREWGDDIDVDRYVNRDPFMWDRCEREPRPSRTVNIGVNLVCGCRLKPEHLLYRGAAALALADVLTTKGYNVGITAFTSTVAPASGVELAVNRYTIKRPDMPLDLGALAMSLCEIAFYRLVCVCGHARHFRSAIAAGNGFVRKLPGRDAAEVDYLIDSDVVTERRAIEWLRDSLRKGVQRDAA